MSINLKRGQEAWLLAHVATGDFAPIEEAARRLIDDRIAQIAAAEGEEDLDWAKPFLEEARASIARGEGLSLDEHRARNAARRSSRGQ